MIDSEMEIYRETLEEIPAEISANASSHWIAGSTIIIRGKAMIIIACVDDNMGMLFIIAGRARIGS
jgi:hypothetical protein